MNWMATDDEVRQVTNAMNIAESMANDCGMVVAVMPDLRAVRNAWVAKGQYSRVIERVRPEMENDRKYADKPLTGFAASMMIQK